jgi:hypothetical protein
MDDQNIYSEHELIAADSHVIAIKPELRIPLPQDFKPQEIADIHQRAKACFRTYLFLVANGLQEPNPEDPKDRNYIEECAREAARQFTGSPVAKRRPFDAQTTKWLNDLLDKYNNQVIEDAVKLRTYVKTRLIEESDASNPDSKASDRLKALESLGKLSDLGMFKETVEVNVNTKSTEELKEELVRRLGRYMGAAQVVESPTKQQRRKMIVDLNKALGRDQTDNG